MPTRDSPAQLQRGSTARRKPRRNRLTGTAWLGRQPGGAQPSKHVQPVPPIILKQRDSVAHSAAAVDLQMALPKQHHFADSEPTLCILGTFATAAVAD
jgi:hypothetical protein